MAYQPYDRNASGIVYFGTNSTDQVFESNSNFVVDTANSQVKVPNIVLSDDGKIGCVSNTGILTLGSDGVATFVSGVVIAGDLTVQGSQVILNTETLAVEDNIILLNKNVTGSPSTDAGLEIERGDSTNVRLQWDEGEDYWSFTNNGSNYHPMGVARSGLIYDTAAGNKYYFDIGAGNGITVNADDIAVTAGTGISVDGNGVNINVTGLTELTTAANDDVLLIYDTDAASHKKITKTNLISGLGAFSNFIISDGSTTQTVDDGETVTFAASTGLDVAVSATNTVTYTIDVSEYSDVTPTDGDKLLTLDSDGSTHQLTTLASLATLFAGNGLGAASSVLSVNVDNSTVEINSDSVRVKDAGITEVKRSRTVDSSFTTGDTISSDINLVSGGAGGINIKLPAPATGKMVIVKKIDSAAGTVTVSQNSAETIDGTSSKILYYQYETLTFVSDGTNWFVI